MVQKIGAHWLPPAAGAAAAGRGGVAADHAAGPRQAGGLIIENPAAGINIQVDGGRMRGRHPREKGMRERPKALYLTTSWCFRETL
jgi:hypothetical protein